MSILRRVILYYAQIAVFSAVTYGVLMLLYDTSRLSFIEWLLVMAIASTIGIVPYVYQMVREKNRVKEGPVKRFTD